jgi:hypothetical protein
LQYVMDDLMSEGLCSCYVSHGPSLQFLGIKENAGMQYVMDEFGFGGVDPRNRTLSARRNVIWCYIFAGATIIKLDWKTLTTHLVASNKLYK